MVGRGWTVLSLRSPLGSRRSYAKQRLRVTARATKVLMRGQSHNHPGMVPGLFRPPTHAIPRPSLLDAEMLFEKQIRRRVKLGRFKRPHLAALLQHYGYRTSWLDVVDNLWVAVWFATNSIGAADKRSRVSTHQDPRVRVRSTSSLQRNKLTVTPWTSGMRITVSVSDRMRKADGQSGPPYPRRAT